MDHQHVSRDADLGIICESGLWIFSIFFYIFFLFERFQCFDKMPLQHFIKIIQQLFLSVRKAFIAMITEDIEWRRFVSQTFCLILIYLADDIATEAKCLYPTISKQVWGDIIGSFYGSEPPGLRLEKKKLLRTFDNCVHFYSTFRRWVPLWIKALWCTCICNG